MLRAIEIIQCALGLRPMIGFNFLLRVTRLENQAPLIRDRPFDSVVARSNAKTRESERERKARNHRGRCRWEIRATAEYPPSVFARRLHLAAEIAVELRVDRLCVHASARALIQ